MHLWNGMTQNGGKWRAVDCFKSPVAFVKKEVATKSKKKVTCKRCLANIKQQKE